MNKDSKSIKEGNWIRELYRNYITPPYYEYKCSVCSRKVLYAEENCPYCFSVMKDVIDK